jgi:hypothetical protein
MIYGSIVAPALSLFAGYIESTESGSKANFGATI